MKAVEPAPHEFAANFIFDTHGLDPFFAADRCVKDGGGSQRATFDLDDEEWSATLWVARDTGLLPPEGGATPTGTEWRLEEIREFHLTIKSKNDPVGKRSFDAHIAPRWQGLKAEKKDGSTVEISVPDEIEEGINIRVTGSNIDFGKYHDLLQSAADSVGINSRYFDEPHRYSNVVDAARYVRLHTDRSGPVHGRDGPIAQMHHLLENDRDGYRKIVQDDQDIWGDRFPGWYHTVTLGPKRVRHAFPDHASPQEVSTGSASTTDVERHAFPREVKHYYAQDPRSFPKDHPLSHPKLEVSYQNSRWDEKISVDDLEELDRQLDQTLYSVLADAGLEVHVGSSDQFVSDAYFQAENVERDPSWIYDMDLTRIEHDQESIVLKYLADGFSPVEWGALETLVTDGGKVSPGDIADETGYHIESVRRALRRCEELFHRGYGDVALKSPFVAELVHKKMKVAIDAARDAIEASATAAYAADRDLDEDTSAFAAWKSLAGVEVEDEDARMIIRSGEAFRDGSKTTDRLKRLIQKGFDLWVGAGRDPVRYRKAQIRLEDGSRTAAWRYL